MFLSKAQKCKTLDNKEREKAQKNPTREMLMAEKIAPSICRMFKGTLTQKTNFRKENPSVSNAGHARECKLCNLAGAPEFVYKSHYTNQYKKKGDYQKKMNGGVSECKNALHKYKSVEKELRKDLRLLKKLRSFAKRIRRT